jgi:hypothetical protein
VQRILDLDLDFFVDGVQHNRSPDSSRLDGDEFPPWPIDAVLSFLEDQCHLAGPTPGCTVENHREIFHRWRDAIEAGLLVPPFHVTHVDAHADLGLGESSYEYLMTQLLFEDPENRAHPEEGAEGLDDGSFLAFAIACRWISDLVYVFNEGGGDDVLHLFKEGFDPKADHLQLAAMDNSELDKARRHYLGSEAPVVDRLEPRVPLREVKWPNFEATAGYDFVFLTRSPAFTPPEADETFAEVRKRYIDDHFPSSPRNRPGNKR